MLRSEKGAGLEGNAFLGSQRGTGMKQSLGNPAFDSIGPDIILSYTCLLVYISEFLYITIHRE